MSVARNASLLADGSRARALRAWSPAALARAAAGLEPVWRAWCERWGCEARALGACEAHEAADTSTSWLAAGPGAVWIGATQAPALAIQAALFGEGSAAVIASDVAARACDDLVSAVRAFAIPANGRAAGIDEPLPEDLRRWSGAVRIEARGAGLAGELALSLHLDPLLAARLCDSPAGAGAGSGPRAKLGAIVDAVSGRRVRLRIDFDPLTLTLGAIQSLDVGDVLTLEHRLEQPLHVRYAGSGDGSEPVCAAFLGAVSPYRAVELVSPASIPSERSNAMTSANSSPAIVHTLEMSDLSEGPASAAPLSMAATGNPLHQIKARLQVCIGEATITVGELMQAREHQVLKLDRRLSEPVEVMLEGKIVARGELVAVDDQFAVRITELPVPLKP